MAQQHEHGHSGPSLDMDMDSAAPQPGPSHDGSAETVRLRNLDALVRDQDDLERDIGREADKLLLQQATQRDQHRLEKTRGQKEKLQHQVRKTRDELSRPIGTTQRSKLRLEIDRMQGQIQDLDNDISEIEKRMTDRETNASQAVNDASSTGRLPNETQRDFLIRTGKITPFSKFGLSTHGESSATLQGALLDAEEEPDLAESGPAVNGDRIMSHRNLRQPGFASSLADSSPDEDFESDRPAKRRRLQPRNKKTPTRDEDSSYDEGAIDDEVTSGLEDDEDDELPSTTGKQKRSSRRATTAVDDEIEDFRGMDDGNESVYQSRVQRWATRRRRVRNASLGQSQDEQAKGQVTGEELEVSWEDEAYLPHPEIDDTLFDNGYKLPGDIYPSLFDYQKTGVQWLHELYTQQVGGIVGDEMGLGKTIQMISFLAGLQYSRKLDKPIIVVCPATVMKQWVNEFHRWWPPFRVTILHSSGSGMVNLRNESTKEDKLLDVMWDSARKTQPLTSSQKAAKKVLKPILEDGGVLVTTYSGLQTYAPLLIPVDWQYAILDEGHKIRNPNTAITIYCKELRTPNRIILSGTPMQNNLIELWSLFDFVFPMRLGTLVNFRNQFEIPIRQGGYANASNLQVQTAFKCAETLKDAISPYLLQRFKVDVASDLPKKSEQVLFCKLSKLQRAEYNHFISSGEMDAIMNGKRQVLYGVDILRKICNHPDLTDHKRLSIKPGYDYGNPVKSGKMQVVGSLLELWKDTGHKTLLFAQHRIMLDILEKFVRSLSGFKYRRMDGNTPIPTRQSMVDEFNTDPDLHVFLLTTKVGGLGINLTGADRVIIYDPDWNPSTDLQARERAWRLGQKREVTIYRLMTAGTIEEKIYHRQIFKQFLTNKILKDPKQRQTFHLNDLHDLFSLTNEGDPTETSTLFKDAQVNCSATGAADGAHPTESKVGKDATASDGQVDIKKLPGISSMEQYAGEVEEEKQANEEGATNSEARMMEGIFARSGIHSAVEHDAIIDGKSARKVAADPVMIEKEAKKVAAEAANELRRAGEVARTVPIGTPTWTGQVGVSGRPQETTAQRAFSTNSRSRGGGLQSSSLLSTLQQRQANVPQSNGTTPRTSSPVRSSGSAASASRSGTPSLPQGKDFGKLIRDYLTAHGGSVHTQMLIDHFNRFCTTPQATMDFKETLKVLANLDKGGRGRGRWVLKDEYKR
ncbi:DNA excision repair protein ERCC-6 [Exophiala aquamarina CBS 119918]|uniref:DNA excision repair protein ERCC-6 n=1 Tax=Exophiala aquamarina CBS 119918 TaxID=1182545 RepID=A0A072PIX7_9EURO|nr:DNA excision repair protein ERCC-6 [Exophiala aquamarina CBS 119918]KEF59697.1 DNA excision repair protein ERCC-6 [Exophiala aquamarina CBS 119918]